MKKLLFLVSEYSYFCSHRLNLAKAAQKSGFEVALATRCPDHLENNHTANIKIFPLRYFTRSGLNPYKQLRLCLELFQIYKIYKPDIVHHVAIKPVILGSFIARWLRIPKVVNTLGGLGYLFTEEQSEKKLKKTLLRFMTCQIFRVIFSQKNSTLILQNQDDVDILVQKNAVCPKQVVIIQGAGVDMNAFPLKPYPPEPPVIIVCVARMLWDKGIGELVAAASLLKKQKVPAKIILYGLPDPENPASIKTEQLQAWHDQKIITWKGYCRDVANVYAQCHIAVLPSYREGLPKALLEAASCGRPIVTTDVPGCKEVVQHQQNGLLVPVKDSKALAQALMRLIQNPKLRLQMGKQGRHRVATYFSDTLIHQQTLAVYES